MWEFERFDWNTLRSATSAAKIPQAIEELRMATNDAAAGRAYWTIDNEVVVQGALYEAAPPTACCLVLALATCSPSARPRILEMLFQLANGQSHPSEIEKGNARLDVSCRREVLLAVPLVLESLEHATPDWIDLCVDLLILCADEDRDLRPRVEWYLRRVLKNDVHHGLREMIEGWIDGANG